jgi:eukaryotic-like serine/threonine-protein kinase
MSELHMTPVNDLATLARRIAEGRLPASEALRYAMQVGESLRKIHDAGEIHGAVRPANIHLTDAGAELLPARDGDLKDVITPYTAPEVVAGGTAEPRSDIFSFGAVLYEMLTGRQAFEGESRATLAANLAGAPAPSSGSPAADRVIGPCLAKNPEARTPRMQKILMELKLLTVAAKRAEAAAGPAKAEPEPAMMRTEMQSFEARIMARLAAHEQRVQEIQAEAIRAMNAGAEAVREEMGRLESRIADRLSAHEAAVAELQRSATEAVATLKEQLVGMSEDLSTAQDAILSRPSEQEMSERILSRVDRGFAAAADHIGRVERTMEDLRNHTAHFERSVAADLVDIEQSVKGHTAAIDSARTAMSQTDDLVERVVEALESLQTALLDQPEPGAEQTSFAVN